MLASTWIAACTPLVRDPGFPGAREKSSAATLAGPFDGQVVDASTFEPIGGATVLAIWSYDEGDGFIAPEGSDVVRLETDAAGRYVVPTVPTRPHGTTTRLVSFTLFVYKRGYVGYRSDARFEGGRRSDFVQRHNRVELRKWRDSDSHADHLLFLSPPTEIARLTRWEREAANLDLYRRAASQAGAAEGSGTDAAETPHLQLLDATGLLPPAEVRRRTSYTDAFAVKDLGDLVRTHFYHGVHLQAVDRGEDWDLAYRVWKDPPDLAKVEETFAATLPGVQPTAEITDETWIYDGEDVRAVAFLDRSQNLGVLLACGPSQCVDIETVIILAKFLRDRLGELKRVDAPEEAR